MTAYNLPELTVTRDVIERIQFSVASRNAEAKLSECATHVFAASYTDNPSTIQWQYVASGVACLLRNRELAKNGKKYMWSMSLCLYNVNYGVLVWKGKLLQNCDYTAVADNFHVFALGEVNVIVGLLFSSREHACELNTTYMMWHQERIKDDGKKGPASIAAASAPAANAPNIRFKKEMISKPCNFQHIQGTQALDECLEIEKIKGDILAAFFGLGTGVGRSDMDSSNDQKKKKKKKEPSKARLTFREISLPVTLPKSPPHQNSYPPITHQSSRPHDMTSHSYEGATVNGTGGNVSSPPPQIPGVYNYGPGTPTSSNGYSGDYSQGSQSGGAEMHMEPGNYVNIDSIPSSYGGPATNYANIDSLPHEEDDPTMNYVNIDSLPSDQNVPQGSYTNIDSLPTEPNGPTAQYANFNSISNSHAVPTGNYTLIESLPVEAESGPTMSYANIDSLPNHEENPSMTYANIDSIGNAHGGPTSSYANTDSFANGQGSYIDSPPPRLDFDLQKELADSFLFQSPLMSAN